MKRYPDWPQRLWRATEERKRRPLVWGTLDCLLYGADLVLAMTGEDLARGFRGAYSDEAGAKSLMAAHGWVTVSDVLDAFLPPIEIPRRGDAVLLNEGNSIGIRTDHLRAIGAGPLRPITVKISLPIKAWAVG